MGVLLTTVLPSTLEDACALHTLYQTLNFKPYRMRAGSGTVGVLLTTVLPNTLEDVLALGLAGLAGYVALLNLPLRRAEAKAKLEKVAANFIRVRRCLAPSPAGGQLIQTPFQSKSHGATTTSGDACKCVH